MVSSRPQDDAPEPDPQQVLAAMRQAVAALRSRLPQALPRAPADPGAPPETAETGESDWTADRRRSTSSTD